MADTLGTGSAGTVTQKKSDTVRRAPEMKETKEVLIYESEIGSNAPVTLSVNGEQVVVQRGVPTRVSLAHVEALRHTNIHYEAPDFQANEAAAERAVGGNNVPQGRMKIVRRGRFNFEVRD